MFHHRSDTREPAVVPVRDEDTVVEFRTPEGETVVFEGSSQAEVRARAHDFLAWAS